jgi:3' terminal RNA ribose 2'-O-methyltransferase Hen1
VLLTISTTHSPPSDLGYLLHKHPGRLHTVELSFGRAHVFYPECTDQQATAALLLDVDPIGLVRRGRGEDAFVLRQYVNDRPYVASSMLGTAISKVFGTAMGGRSKERPALAEQPIPLVATLSALPARGGEAIVRPLFEPLGYAVRVETRPLDPQFPAWGAAPSVGVELSATLPLHRLLSHLYVLVPVLDGDKHYFLADDELDKLLRHGEQWLATHPLKEMIVHRYLRHRRSLARLALERLLADVPVGPDDTAEAESTDDPDPPTPSVHQQRHAAVVAELLATGATSVLDLGCAEGTLLRTLLEQKQFRRIVGYDVSLRSLDRAADRLRLDRLPPTKRERIELVHGSLSYRDERLEGFDAAAVVEVIEHFDPPRLAMLEQALFGRARPRWVVVTTPNADYNVRFPTLAAGAFRHRDHRFEFSRQQFAEWSRSIESRFGYAAEIKPVGDVEPDVGSLSQLAVFRRGDLSAGGVS